MNGTKLNYNQLPTTIPQYAKVSLTSTQILNLKGSAVELVPTQGAGQMIVPTLLQLIYHGNGATPYDVSGGGALQFLYGTSSSYSASFSAPLQDILTATDDEEVLQSTFSTIEDFQAPVANVANKALNLTQVGAGEYTSGDGVLDIVIHYLVIPVS